MACCRCYSAQFATPRQRHPDESPENLNQKPRKMRLTESPDHTDYLDFECELSPNIINQVTKDQHRFKIRRVMDQQSAKKQSDTKHSPKRHPEVITHHHRCNS